MAELIEGIDVPIIGLDDLKANRGGSMDELATVTAVVPLADFHAHVTFSDGTERDINLLPYIDAGGVFEPIRGDAAIFRAMAVENDTITWPNGADIDPEVLYYDLGPNATEEAWRAARARLEPARRGF